MSLFLDAIFTQVFMQNALFGGVLASLVCGVVGPFVVVRRIGYIVGAIAHTVLGGMGVSFYYGGNPMIGAAITAVFAAVIISLTSHFSKENEDTIIGALWAFGMAVGILFIAKTPGYSTDLMTYLFGNLLMVGKTDLNWMVGLGLVSIAFIGLFYRQLMAITFDEEFARTRGLRVAFLTTALYCVIALVVVILIRVVGLILVIALISLPVVISQTFCKSFPKIMISSFILGATITTIGLFLAYEHDLPVGAVIIVLLVFAYFVFGTTGYLIKSFGKRKLTIRSMADG